MPTWRIYYDDGSTYSDADGPVELAPCTGVLVIVQRDPRVGVVRWFHKHHYAWDHAQWLGLGDERAPGDGLWGLVDYLSRPGWKKVLSGRTVPYAAWTSVLNQAMTDPDFQDKSALLPTEERPPRA